MKKNTPRTPSTETDTAFPRTVGRVTPKERDEIQTLYDRKNGLTELVQVLQQNGGLENNNALYEKVVADLGRTTNRSKQWWAEKAKAYDWENIPGAHWMIDFDTCEISLNK